jgi:hypothetical protein
MHKGHQSREYGRRAACLDVSYLFGRGADSQKTDIPSDLRGRDINQNPGKNDKIDSVSVVCKTDLADFVRFNCMISDVKMQEDEDNNHFPCHQHNGMKDQPAVIGGIQAKPVIV